MRTKQEIIGEQGNMAKFCKKAREQSEHWGHVKKWSTGTHNTPSGRRSKKLTDIDKPCYKTHIKALKFL